MPKHVEPAERKKLTDKYLGELRSQSTPESDRTLEMYKYVSRIDRLDHDERFFFLACQRLRTVRRCPHGHYRKIRGRVFCRRRYLCLACDRYRINVQQVKDWQGTVLASLMSKSLYLGPVESLSWAFPNPSDPDALKPFAKHLNDRWQAGLTAQGVPPGEWSMLRNFDPIRGRMRAVYFGPPIDVHTVTCFNRVSTYETSHRVIPASRGKQSPWQIESEQKSYLLRAGDAKTKTNALFGERIADAITWLSGDADELLGLPPDLAYNLYRAYRGRRLAAKHGLAYGSTEPIELSPTLTVERLLRDGTVEPMSMESLSRALIDASAAAADTQSDVVCPDCGSRLVESFEEDSGHGHDDPRAEHKLWRPKNDLVN